MNTYLSNNLVRIFTAVTQSIGGAPIDPTTVTCKMQTPDGNITDLSTSIVHDSTGNFHVDYLPTQLGVHTYEWIGTGVAQVASIGQFMIIDVIF